MSHPFNWTPERFPLPAIETCRPVAIPGYARRELWDTLTHAPGAAPYLGAYALSAANTTRDFYIRVFAVLNLDLDAELDRIAAKFGRERKRGPATGALSRIPARYLAAEAEMKRRGFNWRDDVKKWLPAQSWD